jgi:hypothetical protein
VLLILLIISEFGGAIWALISPVKFENQMTKAMEASFSSYTKHNDVAEKWKSLQEQVIFPGLYRKLTSLVVYWSEFLTTDHEVPGSFPDSTMGPFP